MGEFRNPYKGRLILSTEEGTVILDRMRPFKGEPKASRREVEAKPQEEREEGPRFVTGEAVEAEPVTEVEVREPERDEDEAEETDED